MSGQDLLQSIAEKEKVAIITFIATDKLVRISPARSSSASISVNDAYELEKRVDEKCRGIDSAFLLLHSPGGSLSSSYNIARFLRKRFNKNLHIFVPYEAASGATLMSLAGNKITLGDLGYLTPIDPQVFYKGEWVSSYGIIEKVGHLEDKFKKMRPEEMPIPWRQMVDKIDLINYREMETNVWEAQMYANKLLKLAGYERIIADIISRKLARNTYSHGHCLDRDECIKMGLNIDSSEKSMSYLAALKEEVHRINEEESDSTGHYIDIILPVNKTSANNKKKTVIRERIRVSTISQNKNKRK